MNHRLPAIVALMLAPCAPLSAGWCPADTTVPTASPATITFLTDVDSARVIIDGSFVGCTPVTVDTLQPGMHEVRLFHPDVENWLTERVTDSINVSPGDVRTLRYAFVPRYLLRSIPDGAEVYLGDSLVGAAPSIIRITSRMEGQTIQLRKEGYETIPVQPAHSERGVITVMLPPLWRQGSQKEAVFREEMTNGKRNLRLYIAGTATVLSGVAAAYFKVLADNRYDEYLRTGNPALRTETNKLDTASGVALAITQIGLGLFTYFLLSE